MIFQKSVFYFSLRIQELNIHVVLSLFPIYYILEILLKIIQGKRLSVWFFWKKTLLNQSTPSFSITNSKHFLS